MCQITHKAFVGDVCGLGAENTGGRENTALLEAADEGSGVFDGPAKDSFVGKIAADECDAGVGLSTGDVGEAGCSSWYKGRDEMQLIPKPPGLPFYGHTAATFFYDSHHEVCLRPRLCAARRRP